VITILGADWCPACTKAKKTVEEYELPYKYIHIPPGQPGWEMVETLTGKRSIPQIFYHLGGNKDLTEVLNSFTGETVDVTE
jgi:glutaredoxin